MEKLSKNVSQDGNAPKNLKAHQVTNPSNNSQIEKKLTDPTEPNSPKASETHKTLPRTAQKNANSEKYSLGHLLDRKLPRTNAVTSHRSQRRREGRVL